MGPGLGDILDPAAPPGTGGGRRDPGTAEAGQGWLATWPSRRRRRCLPRAPMREAPREGTGAA